MVCDGFIHSFNQDLMQWMALLDLQIKIKIKININVKVNQQWLLGGQVKPTSARDMNSLVLASISIQDAPGGRR
jgi:hypothetical protein